MRKARNSVRQMRSSWRQANPNKINEKREEKSACRAKQGSGMTSKIKGKGNGISENLNQFEKILLHRRSQSTNSN